MNQEKEIVSNCCGSKTYSPDGDSHTCLDCHEPCEPVDLHEAMELRGQELPLSDKDIQVIQDCLAQVEKSIYSVVSKYTFGLTKEAKDSMMERAHEINLINAKLNR